MNSSSVPIQRYLTLQEKVEDSVNKKILRRMLTGVAVTVLGAGTVLYSGLRPQHNPFTQEPDVQQYHWTQESLQKIHRSAPEYTFFSLSDPPAPNQDLTAMIQEYNTQISTKYHAFTDNLSTTVDALQDQLQNLEQRTVVQQFKHFKEETVRAQLYGLGGGFLVTLLGMVAFAYFTTNSMDDNYRRKLESKVLASLQK